MTNEKNQKSEDIVTAKKIALKEAFRRADEIEWASLPEEDSIEWEFSPRFEQKMQKLLRQSSSRPKGRVLRMTWTKLAAACVALCLLIVCLMSVSANKKAVSNLILTPADNHNYEVTMEKEYLLSNGKTAIAPDEAETWYLPSYIPTGYIVNYASADIFGLWVCWEREDGKAISFTQHLAGGSALVDARDASISTVPVGEHEGTLIKSDSIHKLLWDNHGYLFWLFYPTDISDDEAVKMAKSLTAHSMEEINTLKKE